MIRDISNDEIPVAAALAADAFREDSGFSHILPDRAARYARLPSLISALLSVDLAAGARVRVAVDENVIVGLSSVLPAGTPEPNVFAWLRHAAELRWLAFSPNAVLRGLETASAVARLRPSGSDYLHLLAVHPACHGRGIGAALVRDVLSSGRSVYLETFGPTNRAWYAARGFVESAEVRSNARPPFWTFRSS